MPTEESDEPPAQPLPREGDVWYVSYGSNMSEKRLSAYLEGGVPPRGQAANPGAHDPTPPRRSVPGDPLVEVVVDGIDGGRHHVGPGHYETLVEVGRFEGVPMLTFTAPHALHHVEHNEPSPAYLAMLADGLRESRQWSDEDIAAYFERVVPAEYT